MSFFVPVFTCLCLLFTCFHPFYGYFSHFLNAEKGISSIQDAEKYGFFLRKTAIFYTSNKSRIFASLFSKNDRQYSSQRILSIFI